MRGHIASGDVDCHSVARLGRTLDRLRFLVSGCEVAPRGRSARSLALPNLAVRVLLKVPSCLAYCLRRGRWSAQNGPGPHFLSPHRGRKARCAPPPPPRCARCPLYWLLSPAAALILSPPAYQCTRPFSWAAWAPPPPPPPPEGEVRRERATATPPPPPPPPAPPPPPPQQGGAAGPASALGSALR